MKTKKTFINFYYSWRVAGVQVMTSSPSRCTQMTAAAAGGCDGCHGDGRHGSERSTGMSSRQRLTLQLVQPSATVASQLKQARRPTVARVADRSGLRP